MLDFYVILFRRQRRKDVKGILVSLTIMMWKFFRFILFKILYGSGTAGNNIGVNPIV